MLHNHEKNEPKWIKMAKTSRRVTIDVAIVWQPSLSTVPGALEAEPSGGFPMFGRQHLCGLCRQRPWVNVNKKLWKDPPFLMGKSTISMAIFNSYVTNYQRVPGSSTIVQPGQLCKFWMYRILAFGQMLKYLACDFTGGGYDCWWLLVP